MISGRTLREGGRGRGVAAPRFVRVAFGLVVAIVLTFRAAQLIGWSAAPQWGYDFSAYWLAGRHLLEGETIYAAAQLAGPYAPQGQFLYLYPPFLAVLAMPFAWLFQDSYGPAGGAWALGGAAITVAGVLGIARLERLPPPPPAAPPPPLPRARVPAPPPRAAPRG